MEDTMKKKLPIFTTPEGRAKYLAAYEAMLSLWKVPYDSIDVQTGYGSTHINVSGPDDGHPLVFLHAVSLSSTAWFANIAELGANHRVYAVDAIGDAGKSIGIQARSSAFASQVDRPLVNNLFPLDNIKTIKRIQILDC